jgi:hypothetical protein
MTLEEATNTKGLRAPRLLEVGSNRTVMLPNSVQQSTRDRLESYTLAPDYIEQI